MGDMLSAEEIEVGAAYSQLFESSMRSEARRLRTFQQWPDTSPVSPRDLVKAGFFFVGPRDDVQCFCCGGVLRDWAHGSCPIAEHLKFFPSCKFIRGEDVGNQEMLPLQAISDTVDGQFLSLLQGVGSEETDLLDHPGCPEMETEEMRLSTFHNWPQHADMRPEQLARAGFYYTGRGDLVRCFHCDGGVRSWSLGDDPWREHARWYPECVFVLQAKGPEYVSSVQASFSSTCLTPGDRNTTERESSASKGPSRDWELQVASQDEFNIVQKVLELGFEPTLVFNMMADKYLLTGTQYRTQYELLYDLLHLGEDISSAEESGDTVQTDAETSITGEEMQPVQLKESDESRRSTEEQLQRLQEERMCKVCMDRDVSVVFVPCGHLVACRDCALNLRLCPICRAVIQESVRTFMS